MKHCWGFVLERLFIATSARLKKSWLCRYALGLDWIKAKRLKGVLEDGSTLWSKLAVWTLWSLVILQHCNLDALPVSLRDYCTVQSLWCHMQYKQHLCLQDWHMHSYIMSSEEFGLLLLQDEIMATFYLFGDHTIRFNIVITWWPCSLDKPIATVTIVTDGVVNTDSFRICDMPYLAVVSCVQKIGLGALLSIKINRDLLILLHQCCGKSLIRIDNKFLKTTNWPIVASAVEEIAVGSGTRGLRFALNNTCQILLISW